MASLYAQLAHRVRLEWGPIGAAETAPDSTYAVVVDVLSFTTTLVSALGDAGVDGGSPEASAAAYTFEAFQGSLSDALRACTSGQELICRGFGADVDIAAELDSSPHVPVLRGDAFVRAE